MQIITPATTVKCLQYAAPCNRVRAACAPPSLLIGNRDAVVMWHRPPPNGAKILATEHLATEHLATEHGGIIVLPACNMELHPHVLAWLPDERFLWTVGPDGGSLITYAAKLCWVGWLEAVFGSLDRLLLATAADPRTVADRTAKRTAIAHAIMSRQLPTENDARPMNALEYAIQASQRRMIKVLLQAVMAAPPGARVPLVAAQSVSTPRLVDGARDATTAADAAQARVVPPLATLAERYPSILASHMALETVDEWTMRSARWPQTPLCSDDGAITNGSCERDGDNAASLTGDEHLLLSSAGGCMLLAGDDTEAHPLPASVCRLKPAVTPGGTLVDGGGEQVVATQKCITLPWLLAGTRSDAHSSSAIGAPDAFRTIVESQDVRALQGSTP